MAVRCCSGVSLKTQEMYALVFLTRYLDLFFRYVSLCALLPQSLALRFSAHGVLSRQATRPSDRVLIAAKGIKRVTQGRAAGAKGGSRRWSVAHCYHG